MNLRALAAGLLPLMAAVAVVAQDAAPDPRWRRCNTHTHTNAPGPEVNASPETVAEWYRTHGYVCIVITDHEHVTDVAALNARYAEEGDFLVLQGQEITQQILDPSDPLLPLGIRQVHVNAIDIRQAILPVGYPEKPQGGPEGVTAAEIYARNLAEVRAQGGLPQINHPNLQWSVHAEDLAGVEGPVLMELWNAFPSSNNLGGIDAAGNAAPSTEALWDALLSQGKVVWAVASDDAHDYVNFDNRETPTPGKAWIVVRADALAAELVVAALEAGDFYASTGVTLASYAADEAGIVIEIAANSEWVARNPGNARFTTRFIGEGGRVLAEVHGRSPRYAFTGDETYVRASIIDSDGRRAWTQPVFRDGRLGE